MKSIPKWAFFYQSLAITEEVLRCFIFKNTESTSRAISSFHLVSVVVKFSVPCDQAHRDFLFCLLGSSSIKTLTCLQPSAFIHVSLLFSSSHSRECFLINALDIHTVDSGTTIRYPTPSLDKSSGFQLPLSPMYPGVESNSTVLFTVRLFCVW